MGRFLVLSSGGHLFLLAAWLIGSTLLSKPRMSYYAVDLVSSLPSGGSPAVAPTPTPVETPKVPPPPPAPVETRRLPPQDVIKIPSKAKKPPAPKVQKKHGLNLKAALAVLDSQEKKPGKRVGISGESASAAVAEAGQPFPYPWYLKQISERLDAKWNPPAEFSPDTVCVVDFVVHRDGQISDIEMKNPSGDSTFDVLAQRAVLYANPLPPLPNGYQEETLNVHMKFQGK
jgi:protein TonB